MDSQKTRDYFEGWYFKLVDKPEKNIYAIIPGISFGRTLNTYHAFIKYLTGRKEYPLRPPLRLLHGWGEYFAGFLIGLLYENSIYRFATYTGTKVFNLRVSEQEVAFQVTDKARP